MALDAAVVDMDAAPLEQLVSAAVRRRSPRPQHADDMLMVLREKFLIEGR